MRTIELYKTCGMWVCKSKSFSKAMGTDVLPTPFFDTASEKMVVAKIRALNPGYEVIVRN
jgi:hypothetical protein